MKQTWCRLCGIAFLYPKRQGKIPVGCCAEHTLEILRQQQNVRQTKYRKGVKANVA